MFCLCFVLSLCLVVWTHDRERGGEGMQGHGFGVRELREGGV
ncbi:hypothetical protein Hanom_Chr09g00796241 [Helianthus anomalus]